MRTNTIRESINPELVFEGNLGVHPWISPWVIRVSEGLSFILNDFLNDIEDILGPEPELAFLRITEELNDYGRDHDISTLYQRRFRIFIEARESIDARNEALRYVTANAIGASIDACFRCGHPLEVKNIKDKDERKLYPFLPVIPGDSNGVCFSNVNICMSCALADWQRGPQAIDESIADPEDDGTAERWAQIKAAEKIHHEKAQGNELCIEFIDDDDEQEGVDCEQEPEAITIKKEVAVFSTDEVDALSLAYAEATRDQSSRIKGLVKKIRKGSPLKQLVIIPEQWRKFCDDLSEKFPNFREVNLFIRNQLALSAASDKVLRLPPIILVGNPGIGKTEWSLSVSDELNTILKVIDISNSQTGSPLTGSESHWSNSQPGMLFHTLVLGDIANPIVMLDEIDKARGRIEYNPLAALHQLLEPRQAKNFHDLSVPELGIDASHVIWIATANSVEGLEGPIVDRFTVFNIADPSKEQMPAIVTNQYLRFLDKHPSGSVFERTIRDDVLRELCGFHPRKVRKILELAFGLAAYDNRDYLTVKDVKVGDVGDKQKPGIGFMSSIEPA